MGEKKAKASWVRPAAEVQEALDRQIRLLRSSCRGYDEGTLEEALRLATGVFVILDDVGQRSLVTQLGLRASFQPIDSATPNEPGNLIPYIPLVSMYMSPNSATRYGPRLQHSLIEPTKFRLSHWWEKNVIYNNQKGITITRRKLAQSLRNQDGGSHFDPQLTDHSYVNLSRENGAGWHVDGVPLKDIHFAMMRTIAWELDLSLVDAGLVAGPVVVPDVGA